MSQAAMEPREIRRWMIWPRNGESSILVLVVDDEDELAAVIARENIVPSPNFGGVWGGGERDGNWLVSFRLLELGGKFERNWLTDNIHRPLLEEILEVPHLVAIIPEEIAGDANSADEIAPRLGGSMILEVDTRSEHVAEILAQRGGEWT